MRFIYYLIAALWGLSFWFVPTHDPDFGWHLLGGVTVLTTGDVPRQDFINTFGGYWIDYHWLGQSILYKAYQALGFENLRYAVGIFMAIFGLLFAYFLEVNYSKKSPRFIPIITLLILGDSLRSTFSIRPQIFGLFCIILTLTVLARNRSGKIELPIIFLITALVANIHVYWVLIPMIWLIYRVIPRYVQKADTTFIYSWGGFFFISLAGLISPYGIFQNGQGIGIWSNYAVIFDYLTMPEELSRAIIEFQPGLSQLGPPFYGAVLCLIVFSAVLSKSLIKKLFCDLSIALIGLWQMIKAIKFASIFAIFAAPILVRLFPIFLFRRLKIPLLMAKKYDSIIMILILSVSIFRAAECSPYLMDMSAYMTYELPGEACRRIESLNLTKNSKRDHIRVLTHFDFGGWCRWYAYEKNPSFDMRVTTDGRTQLIPPDHFKKYFDLYALKNDWAKTLMISNPDVVVVKKAQALAQILVRDPSRWVLMHEDATFALFVPKAKS
jgi:hypothetical protein